MSGNPIEEINKNNIVANTEAGRENRRVRNAPPVEPAAPVAASTGDKSIGVADEGKTSPADLAELSREGRARSGDAMRNGELTASLDDAERVAVPASSLSSLALKELLRSFQDYDNSEAQTSFNYYLNMFTRYSQSPGEAAAEESAQLAFRAMENADYRRFGVTHFSNVTREVRERMGKAIDRWFVGEGVFTPEMLHYTSSDGFGFTPLSEEAVQASRATGVRSTYEREVIARYLRRMATLTPWDFLFCDPTGLGPLDLSRRRKFLALMDSVLGAGNFSCRAADLRYAFASDGSLDFSLLNRRLDDERRRMQDYIAYQLNTYQGQLRESVRQYGAGIVSASQA